MYSLNTFGVSDGSGQSCSIAASKNDDTGILATGWNGNHYYRSGTTKARTACNLMWTLNFSPFDAAYIWAKIGGGGLITTDTHPHLYPDNLGDRVLISGWRDTWSGNDIRFWHFQSQGTGGPNAPYCVDNSVTPAQFNLQNPNKLCGLIIKADF